MWHFIFSSSNFVFNQMRFSIKKTEFVEMITNFRYKEISLHKIETFSKSNVNEHNVQSNIK